MTGNKTVSILVVDDELHICKNCVKILSREESYDVQYRLNGVEALETMQDTPFDIVLTDLKMGRLSGMEVLARIKEVWTGTVVIVMTGYTTVSSAVEVMKLGAFDYLPKPFTPHELRAVVKQAVERMAIKKQQYRLMRLDQGQQKISHQLVGNSPGIKKAIQLVQKVAPTDATVFISGESGTGKELIARAVHINSRRRDQAFFAIDCGTLSGDLLESELFGHAKGAFTGADKEKPGIFQLADKGTVFLDEISNIGMDVQGKLLRFLENREFIPLGSTRTVQVDVRLIFATNRDLEEMADQGHFRRDFYYRIFVYPIEMPPLRQRQSDILPIAYYFLKAFAEKMGKAITGFDDRAANRLVTYEWPGNVRQLKNVVERAVILAEGGLVSLPDLSLVGGTQEMDEICGQTPKTNEELKEVKKEIRQQAVSRVEKNFILDALSRNQWNVTRASRETGLQRTSFQALMRKYGISKP